MSDVHDLHIGWTLGLPRLPSAYGDRITWMESVLERVHYRSLSRDAKVMVRSFLEVRSGCTRQDVMFVTVSHGSEEVKTPVHSLRTVGLTFALAAILLAQAIPFSSTESLLTAGVKEAGNSVGSMTAMAEQHVKVFHSHFPVFDTAAAAEPTAK